MKIHLKYYPFHLSFLYKSFILYSFNYSFYLFSGISLFHLYFHDFSFLIFRIWKELEIKVRCEYFYFWYDLLMISFITLFEIGNFLNLLKKIHFWSLYISFPFFIWWIYLWACLQLRRISNDLMLFSLSHLLIFIRFLNSFNHYLISTNFKLNSFIAI